MPDEKKNQKKDGADIIPLPARKGPTGAACPLCGKPRADGFAPFCSKRCADLDLGRWLNEDYRVAADEPADGSDIPTEDWGADDQDR